MLLIPPGLLCGTHQGLAGSPPPQALAQFGQVQSTACLREAGQWAPSRRPPSSGTSQGWAEGTQPWGNLG